jgi:hypothetical protein
MKHFLIITLILCVSFAAKAQYTPVPNQPKVDNTAYKEIRNKSTNAKIEAVILNIGAITLCAVGTVMVVVGELDKSTKTDDGTSYDSNGNPIPADTKTDDNLINSGIAVTGGGVVLGIGSAVLYTRSGILYHKARELKMSMNTNSINIPESDIRSFRAKQIGLGISVSL